MKKPCNSNYSHHAAADDARHPIAPLEGGVLVSKAFDCARRAEACHDVNDGAARRETQARPSGNRLLAAAICRQHAIRGDLQAVTSAKAPPRNCPVRGSATPSPTPGVAQPARFRLVSKLAVAIREKAVFATLARDIAPGRAIA
jgi:hypothetical protein